MNLKNAIVREADVLVVGGGLAGCYASIKAKENGADKVIQVCKGRVGKSGQSTFAAGIMTAFCPEEENYDWAFKEVVEKADYLVDQERLRDHLNEVWNIVREMESFGVEFEKTKDGKFARHYGRGNIKNVMFHGPQLMEAMAKTTLKKGVVHVNKTMMTDLLTYDSRVVGAVAFNIENGDFYVFKAKATVLATGPCWYKGLQPGHRDCTGDGYVAAYNIGNSIMGADIVERNAFPARYDIGPGMHMYVGTGAIFLNGKGERFMKKYDPVLNERALQNILLPAFAMEVKRNNGPIYADMTHFTPEQVQRLKRVIPLPIKMYERVGLVKGDKFVKMIEWMATAPKALCGPPVNTKFETGMPGLYACGDAVPWAGLDGGQNAMPGAATSGATTGKCAAEYANQVGVVRVDSDQVEVLRKRAFQPLEREDGVEPDQVVLGLQEAIVPYDVLLLKSDEKMQEALKEIEDIRDNQVPLLFAYDLHYLRMALEARNMVTVAEMQLRSAIARKESRLRDKAIRIDYPYRDNNNWLKWIGVKKIDNKMKVIMQDIPIERYPLKPPEGVSLDPRWQQAQEAGIVKIEQGRIIWV